MWGKKYRFGQKRLAFSLIISTFVPVDMRKLTIIFCALWLIASCGGNGEQMRQQLEVLEQQNRSGEQMLNDSLAESLVDYFDRHGNANERMRARYILGRTYYCMGELPRALETYYEAADCADTTAADCDFAKLSRIHAQSAVIYYDQVQPNSQLRELRLAVYYAKKGGDTLISIECYAQQADAYSFLQKYDSAIYIKEHASRMYSEVGRKDYSALTLLAIVRPLINRNDIEKARNYLNLYETTSGVLDSLGIIEKGREIYYNIKGEYYLNVHHLDSAELMFRKELRQGKDLNNQIAGCKGLQEVYIQKKLSDSVAKYAQLCYELNDSAYSLSEMQNIQKFQASYNYNHNKLLAEQKALEAEQSKNLLIIMIAIFSVIILLGFILFSKYKEKKESELRNYRNDLQSLEKIQTELQDICSEECLSPAEIVERKHKEIVEILNRVTTYQRKVKQSPETLEQRLEERAIVAHLRELAESNPYQKASVSDFKLLRDLINMEIPHFYTTLNTPRYTLTSIEYEVTVLLRVHFSPIEIHRLTGASPSYISNMRSRLLSRIWGVQGSPKDYDERILAIN